MATEDNTDAGWAYVFIWLFLKIVLAIISYLIANNIKTKTDDKESNDAV